MTLHSTIYPIYNQKRENAGNIGNVTGNCYY